MKKLAVIGSPVAHSKSPQIQNGFAQALGLAYEYSAIEVTRDTLAAFIERARGGEFAGFNVTMPLKEAIVPHLDEADGEAVNTVVFRDGRLLGSSTDGVGALRALRDRTGTIFSFLLRGESADVAVGAALALEDSAHGEGSVRWGENAASGDVLGREFLGMNVPGTGVTEGGEPQKNVLILGTGGAAKAAAAALSKAGASVTVLSRREDLPSVAGAEARAWAELEMLAAQADVIINATPLGMHGAVEFENFSWLDGAKREAVVFDFVYDPLETELLRAAKSRRLQTIGGLSLLVFQAAASFERFTGFEVPQDVVAEVMREL